MNVQSVSAVGFYGIGRKLRNSKGTNKRNERAIQNDIRREEAQDAMNELKHKMETLQKRLKRATNPTEKEALQNKITELKNEIQDAQGNFINGYYKLNDPR